MNGIWDDARQQAVEAAILGTEVSYAPGTWTRVEKRLDDYADAWTDKHTEVCEATVMRHEQSEEAMRLRMRCLSKRRTSLRASVDELADANAETVENAVKLVAGLPTLTLCDDLDRLEQQDQLMPPPEDPDVAAEVEAVREQLADIAAMERAGRYAEAFDMVESVVQQAQALSYVPLWAEALHRQGKLRSRNGQYAEAEPDLRQAHALAMRHHHDSVALHTAQALTFLVGARLQRHVEGQQWGEMDALPLAQRSGDPLQEAHGLNSLGIVSYCQGDYENARIHHQRALKIQEKALGPDHPDVAQSLNNLGVVFNGQGDYENARIHHQRALEIRKKVLGPDHPNVTTSLNNLGITFYGQGDYESARIHHQRALKMQESAIGPDHPSVASSLDNLGNVFDSQGDYENAQVHHRRALEIREQALGPDHPSVATSLVNLGNVRTSQGDYENAGIHYLRALEVWEKALGSDHPNVAASLVNLGIVLRYQGDYESARVHYQRALNIWERALGPDHPNVATSLDNLGNVLFSQGDYENARVHHQRALEIQEKALGPSHPDVASSLANLGNVFYSQGDYENAQVHYQRALAIREKALGPDHPRVAIVLVGLATVALGTGDSTSARAHAERAVSICEMTTGAPQVFAEAHFVLARVLWSERSERMRANELAELARKTLAMAEGPGGPEVDLDDVDAWLATHRLK